LKATRDVKTMMQEKCQFLERRVQEVGRNEWR